MPRIIETNHSNELTLAGTKGKIRKSNMYIIALMANAFTKYNTILSLTITGF